MVYLWYIISIKQPTEPSAVSNFRPRHAAHLRRGRAQRAFEDDALVAPGLDDRQAVAPGTNWRRPVGGFTIGKP